MSELNTDTLAEGDTVTLTIDVNGDEATNDVTVMDVSYSGKSFDVETASGKTYLLNTRAADSDRVAVLVQSGREVADVTEMEA